MFSLDGYGGLLLQGTKLTLAISIFAMTIAVGFGLLGAWGKLSSIKPVAFMAESYTTIIRGIPELVLILLVYYGAPTIIQDLASMFNKDIYVNLNPFIAGVMTIGFIYGAFATEIFRGAYLAVSRGQIEAAHACGMNRILLFRRILLPQMWRFALPGLGNVWMILIKATALVSVIQLPELMRNADIASRATKQPFTCYFAASLIYLLITMVSFFIQSRAEIWANRGVRKV
jgi:His/Glu/Gln/Arg/opine family amino acid ABC transporter permease subunit